MREKERSVRVETFRTGIMELFGIDFDRSKFVIFQIFNVLYRENGIIPVKIYSEHTQFHNSSPDRM